MFHKRASDDGWLQHTTLLSGYLRFNLDKHTLLYLLFLLFDATLLLINRHCFNERLACAVRAP